jgi:hypothetical protein
MEANFILYQEQQTHNYFTNYHTPTSSDTPKGACSYCLAKLHKYVKCCC